MKPYFVGLAALLAATPSLAQTTPNYLFIDITGDNAQAGFVDMNSIKRVGDRVTFWALWVNLAPTAAKPSYVSYAMRRYTNDCKADTSQQVYALLFAANGEPLSQGTTDSPVVPVAPDTIAQEMESLACKGDGVVLMPLHVRSIEEAREAGRRIVANIKKEK